MGIRGAVNLHKVVKVQKARSNRDSMSSSMVAPEMTRLHPAAYMGAAIEREMVNFDYVVCVASSQRCECALVNWQSLSNRGSSN